MTVSPVIVWFRDDLRLADNPALHAAARTRRPLICIYIHDEQTPRLRQPGGAARWWLHGALDALHASLVKRGGALVILRGGAAKTLTSLALATGSGAVYWNRRYGEAERSVDDAIAVALERHGILVATFNGHLLHEPWTLHNQAGAPFRVFTAYWRRAMKQPAPAAPLAAPRKLRFHVPPPGAAGLELVSLADLRLRAHAPDWAAGLRDAWRPTEAAAQAHLRRFLLSPLAEYVTCRDHPGRLGTSRLSPYLRFGNISARQVWHTVRAAALDGRRPALPRQTHKFLAELGWREFNYHILHHHPDLSTCNVQRRFDAFRWRTDRRALDAWQRGLTGYPLVDAGMRELWTTGWMHNRVRMVAASFLVKHLLIDWRVGEQWFWDTLVDADPANNPANWQWVAGCGADAAPYFRIFNPTLQGERFDPDGDYVRRWIPELARLSSSIIHRPWTARASELETAGVRLGKTYPRPIVDHDFARRRALAHMRAMEPARHSRD